MYVSISPENNANIRYKTPISFALEDKNHLSIHKEIDFFISFNFFFFILLPLLGASSYKFSFILVQLCASSSKFSFILVILLSFWV